MTSNERGLQNKSDNSSRSGWEDSRFPILCESCLGETPYVKMLVEHFASNCRMCDRPYTIFKWRPGRSADFTRTQICQTCSKTRNLCQTCIRDLQLGVPSQLRDAVLHSAEDGGAVRIAAADQSDVNREYQTQQQMALINSGLNPHAPGDDPNERILRLARSVASDRQPMKRKLQNLINTAKQTVSSEVNSAATSEGNSNGTEDPYKQLMIPDHIKAALAAENVPVVGQKRPLDTSPQLKRSSTEDKKQSTGVSFSGTSAGTTSVSEKPNIKSKKAKKSFVPRPPPGLPPPSAFIPAP